MKTTKLIAICATVGLLVRALAALAAPLAAVPVFLGAEALGQAPAMRSTPDDRHEVESLLARARQAMKEGKLDAADALVSRAEAMRVEFNVFHLGDTPKKARRDLDAAKRDAKRRAPQLPSEKAKTAGPVDDAPSSRRLKGEDDASVAQKKPVLSQPLGDATAPPSEESLTGIPSLGRSDNAIQRMSHPITTPPQVDGGDQGSQAMSQTASAPNAAPPSGVAPLRDAAGPSKTEAISGDRQQSDALLLAARRALAVGDTRRAAEALAAARKLNTHYEFHDDTPAKFEAMLRRYTDVMEARAGREASEGWRHQYSELLMDEAQQLLRWRDLDEAERLAQDAGRLRVNFGPFEAKPEALVARIALERKKNQPTDAVASHQSAAADKERALTLTTQARGALEAGRLDLAEKLARQAAALGVPDRAFAPGDDTPSALLVDLQKARAQGALKGMAAVPYPTTRAVFDPAQDPTRNRAAGYEEVQPRQLPTPDSNDPAEPVDPLPPTASKQARGAEPTSEALLLVRQGEQALQDREIEKAKECFTRAYAIRNQLDPNTVQRLQDHLQMLSAPQSRSNIPAKVPEESPLATAGAKEQLLIKQLSSEVMRQQVAADKLHEKSPMQARELLANARSKVEESEVDAQHKALLLARIDRSLGELDKYIDANKAQISLETQNKDVLSQVERRRHMKVEVQDKIAKLVDQYNQLIDERRYAEAEVLAKRAREIDPQNPVVTQLVLESTLIRRTKMNDELKETKEAAVWESLDSVERTLIPFGNDNNPIRFPDAGKWEELTKSPSRRAAEGRSHRTERELEIERKLRTPVSLKFRNRPLTEVLEQLAKLAAVNMYLDPQGLSEEGVASDTPVTIDLSQDISLKSALNLILEPLHLSYVIKDEVLKITSEQLRDRQMYQVTYSVADLVIPIPNYVPNNRMGLQGALTDAYANTVVGSRVGSGGQPTAVLASRDGTPASGVISPAILAQMGGMNPGMSGPRTGQMPGNGFAGPGGMTGGAQADFDSLIDLITSTVAPDTWGDAPGQGSIKQFDTNLSLVISHTQDVHDQIADLLKQLRKLQDLQVTIEVRFITLNDNFFERIGVDFQFNIQSNVTANVSSGGTPSPTATVGLLQPGAASPFPNFTSDLSIPFRQNSFSLTTPQFGTPQDVADFGFAILSDLEAYFLVAAAQGDTRSNVMQAPKVTLFNGQQATVSDLTQVPFVISVIPVVGDFAAANQPVIVVLSEGTFLSVQAVVSNDKRFVRLTVVPFFSQIGNVQEFTFAGSSTTTNNTSNLSTPTSTSGDNTTASTNDSTTSSNGVTVQLPSFSFVTVTTTVSVPDGGTVLLGGIKRLSEGRNEFGVPILSKLPYINRLFKNVGIGRETQSLMMMVTPRIIIQEEEEDKLGIAPPP